MNIKVLKTNNKEVFDFLITQAYNELKHNRGLSNIKDEFLKNYIKDINVDDKLYGAYIDSKLVGCAYLTYDNYIKDIYVLKEYKKYEVEKQIIKKIIEDNDKSIISSHINPNSIDKYKKFGFEEIDNVGDSIMVERRIK